MSMLLSAVVVLAASRAGALPPEAVTPAPPEARIKIDVDPCATPFPPIR